MTKSPVESGRAKPVSPSPVSARATLTVRLRSEIRSDVEQSAVRYGRSMSEEIESRLEASFTTTEYLRREWGEDVFRIARAMAGSLSYIEDWSGKNWTEDEETYETLQATMSHLLKNYRDHVAKRQGRSTPHGDFDSKTVDERGQMFAAAGGLPPPRPNKPVRNSTPAPSHDGRAGMMREVEDDMDNEPDNEGPRM